MEDLGSFGDLFEVGVSFGSPFYLKLSPIFDEEEKKMSPIKVAAEP